MFELQFTQALTSMILCSSDHGAQETARWDASWKTRACCEIWRTAAACKRWGKISFYFSHGSGGTYYCYTHSIFLKHAVWFYKTFLFFINIVNNNSFQQLSKLKRSYEKLQRKHLKEAREGALSREEDRAEMSLLNSKMEVQRLAKYKVDFIVYIRII